MNMERARGGSRRAVAVDGRGHAAERTRERILQAAVEEFGAKGYAGARTAAIAARAGVNQQLISYYFGGKRGLLDELRARWREQEASLVPDGLPLAEALTAYMDATLDRPDWARLVVWRALGDGPGEGAETDGERRAATLRAVEVMRERQQAGEVTAAVTPEFAVLLAHALTFAPIAMPQFVQAALGVEPSSPEYRRVCREQLLALLGPREAERRTTPPAPPSRTLGPREAER